MTKICTKCGIEKDESEFNKDKQKKDGYASSCRICAKKLAHKYYIENMDEIKEKTRKWQLANPIKVKNSQINRKEKYREYNRKRAKLNRILRKGYQKERANRDSFFKLSCNIRNLIGNAIRNNGYSKNTKTADILGCSFEEFKIYIENQFTEGMSWDNYPEWEYDHIYPVSLAENEEHLIQLNHYTNFQPLWKSDNRRKANKIL